MKKLIAIISVMLMLTACGSKEKSTKIREPEPEAEQAQTQPVVEEQPAEVTEEAETEEALREEEQEVSVIEGELMEYTSIMIDGGVEDTVGFGFEIPVFDCPGNEKIQEYFAAFVSDMENFTRDAVYDNAMSRGCIVSVYGEVDSAMVEGDVLSVTYSFRCDYSDTEGVEEEERSIHRFHIQTGEPVE